MMRSRWAAPLLALVLSGCAPSTTGPAVDGTAVPRTRSTPTVAVASAAATATARPTADAAREAFLRSFELPSKGAADAPAVLYEFSDYLCSFCRRFAAETGAEIDRRDVRSGRLRRQFYDFPIPGHGLTAYMSHEAAHCAGEQERYWEMHDVLFARQTELTALDPTDEVGVRTALAAMASDAGAEPDLVEACLASRRYRAIINGLIRQAAAQDITVTPTLLLIAGDRHDLIEGHVSLAEFEARLDALLQGRGDDDAPELGAP